jgi:beta-lactamase regulating signal transducer with metallopeptidase domain
MSLLQMSFAGAVMIGVITVIRALTINRLPKKTFLVLWSITLVRLLIPFSLPSALSIYSLFRKSTQQTVLADNPAVVLVPSVPTEQIPATAETLHATAASISVWVVIWAVGALACALFFGFTYWKCLREFQTSLPVENDFTKSWLAEHPLKRPVSIRQSDRISAPLTFGIVHPVILMPKTTDWNDETALQYILTHEFVHIRRFDTVSKLILTVAMCVHWFNPLVWVMYVLANRDLELSCDEAVVLQFGEHTKTAYARTLIRMEETKSGLSPLCNHFSKSAIEERIVAIMKIKKTSLAALLAAAVLVVGVGAALATSAQDSTEGTYFDEDIVQNDGQKLSEPGNNSDDSGDSAMESAENAAIVTDSGETVAFTDEESESTVAQLHGTDEKAAEEVESFSEEAEIRRVHPIYEQGNSQYDADNKVVEESESTVVQPNHADEQAEEEIEPILEADNAGSIPAASNDATSVVDTSKEVSKIASYSVNSKGETYGSSLAARNVDDLPDLIAALGVNGVDGYVRREDFAPDLRTIGEIQLWQAKVNQNNMIPLYDSEGNVIGKYALGTSQDSKEPDEAILSDLNKLTDGKATEYLSEATPVAPAYVENAYPTNAQGETYGSYLDMDKYGYAPELVSVMGDHGMSGYVHLASFRAGGVSDVYDLDGNIIDTFSTGVGD